MVARDELNRRRQPFQTTYSSLNNLRDFRWPPKSLRRRERHANRGLKSWVQEHAPKTPLPAEFSGFTFRQRKLMPIFRKDREDKEHVSGNCQNECPSPPSCTPSSALEKET